LEIQRIIRCADTHSFQKERMKKNLIIYTEVTKFFNVRMGLINPYPPRDNIVFGENFQKMS